MLRSGKVRIAEVMQSESVVRQHKKGTRGIGGVVEGVRGMEVGPYRSFYTELVLAFTGLRSS